MHARLWRVVIVCCLWVSLMAVAEPVGAQVQPFTERWYEATWVIDGDTIRVAGLDASVRLAGIDAPETYEQGFDDSTDFVDWAIFELGGGRVLLQPAEVPRDEYGRYRAYVWIRIDGTTWALIQQGSVMFGYAKMDCYGFASQWQTLRYYEALLWGERYAVDNGFYPFGSPPFDLPLCQ